MFYSIRRPSAALALCFIVSFALTADAREREQRRDHEPVLRRVVKFVRGIIATGDTLTPPQPAPKP